ncbi:MAG: iron ABC transporter permease [Streptococcaceae bacterium]|jgi:iron complex transport system permease protein|nr:iron ABC transporter permease [Streptococcaceae bacterium]
MIRRWKIATAASVLLLLLFSVSYLLLGDKNYALTDIFTNPIILHLRLPRLAAVLLTGALLSASGFLVQLMTKNPIAEMTTLGISGGASLALAVLLVLGGASGGFLAMGSATFGAFVALVCVLVFTAKTHFQPLKVVLVGTSIGLFATSLAGALTFYTHNTQAYFYWIVGSFAGVTLLKLEMLTYVALIFLGVTLIFATRFRALEMGDEMARGLGVNVALTRLVIMALVALTSGVSVASVGVIAFVGLIAPHIARNFSSSAHFWRTLILSALTGMNLLILADLLARNLMKPYEFPAGSLTMLIGAPFFISLMSRKERK